VLCFKLRARSAVESINFLETVITREAARRGASGDPGKLIREKTRCAARVHYARRGGEFNYRLIIRRWRIEADQNVYESTKRHERRESQVEIDRSVPLYDSVRISRRGKKPRERINDSPEIAQSHAAPRSPRLKSRHSLARNSGLEFSRGRALGIRDTVIVRSLFIDGVNV